MPLCFLPYYLQRGLVRNSSHYFVTEPDALSRLSFLNLGTVTLAEVEAAAENF